MKKSAFFTVLLLVVFITPVYAQVFIEQGKVNLTVQPGDHLNDNVTVNNTSNKDLKVKVYWEDFIYQSPFDGAKKFSPAGTSKTSFAKWIEFSPHELVLPPFARKNIAYTINVPPDAKGGYYGVLFVEPESKEITTGDKGLKIITRVGSLFFVETQDRIKKASINDVSLSGCQLKGKLHNEGDVILLPDATYYMIDREGTATDRGELKKYYLPPNETVDFTADFKRDLSVGDYTLVLTFDLQDGDVVVKEVDLSKNSDIECRLNTVRD